VFIMLALAALLTGFYTMRQITLTFLGEPRTQAAEHAHESKAVMTAPLAILAFFSIIGGWVGISKDFPLLGGVVPDWFTQFVGSMLVKVEGVESHSLVPLITSLVVALGGLFLGWWVYHKQIAGSPDPMQRPLGGFYTVLKRKYYIDEFYSWAFIKPAYWLADNIIYKLIDLKILDGILHAIGRFGPWFGRILRVWVDLPVINGAGDKVAAGTRHLGADLKPMQSGRIQQYLLVVLMVLVVVFFVFYYFFVLA